MGAEGGCFASWKENNKQSVHSQIVSINWHKYAFNSRSYAVKIRRHINPYLKSYGYLKNHLFSKYSILMKIYRKPIVFAISLVNVKCTSTGILTST